MHPMLNIAIRAARKTGNLLIKYYENLNSFEINDKNSVFANMNYEAKHLIFESIHRSYPKHNILIEESDILKGGNENIQWIINFLDGTNNFIKHLPHFSVSIAVRIKNRTEIAVVYDPMRNELFTAVRGQGAQFNNYRIRGSNINILKEAILASQLSFKAKEYTHDYIEIIKKLFTQCIDFRSIGSISLDLAYLATGRIDGYFAVGLKPKDFIPGELIVRESGGIITDFIGSHNYLNSGNIVAGNPRIVRAMLSIIRNYIN